MARSYAALPTDDTEHLDGISMIEQHEYFSMNGRSKIYRTLLIIVAGLLCFFGGRFSAPVDQCDRSLATWSPVRDILSYSIITNDGAINASSVYRGIPSPETEEAWDSITKVPSVRIPKSKLPLLHREIGERYLGFSDGSDDVQGLLQVFHSLHCLNELRKNTYREYYPEDLEFAAKHPQVYRMHTDHCIEILRQDLMCAADVTPIVSRWVDGRDLPLPDFSITRSCRDFDRLLSHVTKNVHSVESGTTVHKHED